MIVLGIEIDFLYPIDIGRHFMHFGRNPQFYGFTLFYLQVQSAFKENILTTEK